MWKIHSNVTDYQIHNIIVSCLISSVFISLILYITQYAKYGRAQQLFTAFHLDLQLIFVIMRIKKFTSTIALYQIHIFLTSLILTEQCSNNLQVVSNFKWSCLIAFSIIVIINKYIIKINNGYGLRPTVKIMIIR